MERYIFDVTRHAEIVFATEKIKLGKMKGEGGT